MLSPIFIDGKVAFLAANMAHHVDVGGYAPGSMAIGLREIYQEGCQIPPVKLVKKGVVDRELLALIKQNVRTDIEIDGDIHAQMACNNVGRKRVTELVAHYGLGQLNAYIEEMFNYSERRIRAGLKDIPQGVYEFEDFVEGTPNTAPFVKIAAAVTVSEGNILFDFTGSDEQINDSFNSNLSCTISACYYVVKTLVDPGLPPNGGSFRPITIIAPEGTVVNARPPAAISNSTIIIAPKVVDVLLGALLKALPMRSAAASNGVTSLFNIGGVDGRTGRLYNYIETYAGGQGGNHRQDGTDAVQCHMTNTRNAPAEVIETAYPLLIEAYGLVPDSDGPGEFRGGLGMKRVIRVLSDKTTLTVSTDRLRKQPWGAFGGKGGGNSSCSVEMPDGHTDKLAFSKMTRPIGNGDAVTICTPGAGGWGDPWSRDVHKVVWDVVEELISPERARSEYGVVVRRRGGHYELDPTATEALRASRSGVQAAQ
jgi:N-methylhydantoinase B